MHSGLNFLYNPYPVACGVHHTAQESRIQTAWRTWQGIDEEGDAAGELGRGHGRARVRVVASQRQRVRADLAGGFSEHEMPL